MVDAHQPGRRGCYCRFTAHPKWGRPLFHVPKSRADAGGGGCESSHGTPVKPECEPDCLTKPAGASARRSTITASTPGSAIFTPTSPAASPGPFTPAVCCGACRTWTTSRADDQPGDSHPNVPQDMNVAAAAGFQAGTALPANGGYPPPANPPRCGSSAALRASELRPSRWPCPGYVVVVVYLLCK